MSETTSPQPLPSSEPSPISVQRWPSEIPLLCLVAVAAFWLWVALAISLFGLAYALLLALFFFVSHVVFVAYVRGSAVKLSPRQFPELHARVETLSRRAGLSRPPDAYVMEAGGALNAFATKLFGARMIVLFSDLLDACGDDEVARDMVIGHELGHLRSRHLDFHWLLLPGLFVPFLGAAYSRARELTCDRWGAALCGDPAGAARGLAVLAAGGRLARRVDLAAFADQQRDLDTGWLTLGRWLAPYPPLSRRVEAIAPAGLTGAPFRSQRGPLRAIAILLLAALLPAAALTYAGFRLATKLREIAALGDPGLGAGFGRAPEAPVLSVEERAAAELQARGDLRRLEQLLREGWAESGTLPADENELLELWRRRRGGEEFPQDPFSREPYGYFVDEGSTAMVYSVGADAERATDDDIDWPVDVAVPSES